MLTPALIGRPPLNDIQQDLLVPTIATNIELLSSTMITETLKEAILQQDFQYAGEAIAHQLQAKAEIHRGESRPDRPLCKSASLTLSNSLWALLKKIEPPSG